MTRSLTFLTTFCAGMIFCYSAAAQTYVLAGRVTDAASGEPLAAATVRIVGTPNGTIANTSGVYRFSLTPGSYHVAFSYIGYKSDTVEITLRENKELFVSLVPSAIQMAEVVVTGEDPAMAIMRKVIENKHRWMENLTSYRFEAFTRQVIRRDTSIAMIAESYSTGFWQKGDTLREVIKQRRQTGNVPASQNFAGVGGVINFYEDEIRFSGYRFIGPTSPDAFGSYDFKLERTRQLNGMDVFDISLIPKSRVEPLFTGRISVIDEKFALVGVDVVPNEVFNIPFISDLRISYSQQFRLFEERFWMPVDIRINGTFRFGITGLTLPALGIEGTSTIYDYQINPILADTIKIMPRRIVGIEAEKFDSSYWARREVLPLTTEEQTAYVKLDSTDTLEKQFKPSGPLATLADGAALGALQYVDVRYNRAEGLFLGAKADVDSAASWVHLFGGIGYGISDDRTKWYAGGELFFDVKRRYSGGVRGYDRLAWMIDGDRHEQLSISIASLFYKADYRDYYRSRGIELFLSAKPSRSFAAGLQVRSEDHFSMPQTTDYSFFYRGSTFRPQPVIREGTLREVGGSLRFGREPILFGIVPVDYAQVSVEYASSSLLPTDFAFTRFMAHAEYHVATMLRNLFLPPKLTIRMTGGWITGNAPVQKFFTLDSRYVGFSPAGTLRGAGVKEFGGDRFAVMSLEHNFRSTPFLGLHIPYFYKNSIELTVTWSVARAWNRGVPATRTARPTDGWYQEAGVGLNRILGLFSVDVTYRFARPQNVVFSFGIASLL